MRNRYGINCVKGFFAAGLLCLGLTMPVMAAELPAPENVRWGKAVETTAAWKKVEEATGYQVRLYYDGEYIQTVYSSINRADLSKYMEREGWYYYEVRAVSGKKSGGNYQDRSEYVLSDDLILKDLGETGGKWKNYVSGKKYQKKDGKLVENGWQKIVGKWYFFDEKGYAVTGWKQVGETWYYMDENGVMQTGWIEDQGNRYYLDSNGAMQTGWMQLEPSTWCYLQENGVMAVNTVVDGYTFNAQGIWVQK